MLIKDEKPQEGTILNKPIMVLTLSDIFVWGTYLVISPIIAIYLNDKFGVATVALVQIGTAIYYATRAIFQIPIGYLTDYIKSDLDEILLLFLGSLMMCFPFLLYPRITEYWQYFILEFVMGAGSSINLNNWRKLFSRNIPPGKEGMAYGVYETVMSISTALLGLTGGLIMTVNRQYFDSFIVITGISIGLGAFLSGTLMLIKRRRSSY
jgi:MFS family permease